MKKKLENVAAFSLIEAILASAIFVLILTALGTVSVSGQESIRMSGARTRAQNIALEGIEAPRNIRDYNFSQLASGTYGLVQTNNEWGLAGASDIADIFTRTITLTKIDTRRFTLTSQATWTQNAQRTGAETSVTRVTDWRRDFSSWSGVSQVEELDLEGVTDATKLALFRAGATVYLIAAKNNGSGQGELFIVNATNPNSLVLTSSLEVGNDVNDIAIAGNTAVLATSGNSSEFVVVDVSSPSTPLTRGVLNLPGNANAVSVTINSTTAFLGRDSSSEFEIYTISIANLDAPSTLDTLEFGADVTAISLTNTSLYGSSKDNSNEFFVVDVSNVQNINLIATYNASGNDNGTTVTSFASYAALGRDNGEVIILSVSTPANPTLLGSIDIGNSVNDITSGVGDIYLFAATNTASTPNKIINISNLNAPTLLGNASGSNDTNGIVWDFDQNRAYTVGKENTEELTVLAPN